MLKLFPYPNKFELNDGVFPLPTDFSLSLDGIVGGFAADWLCYVEEESYKDTVFGEEGYALEVSKTGVKIRYNHPTGKFYALITLKQLAYNYNNSLPFMTLLDTPRLSYRGFMLDNGRYFFAIDDIKKLIDLCALHKINVFHWHLTEDQGWRIQIDKHPRLTEIGSVRSGTNFRNKPHGGFYSKDDMKEIVAYCKQRHITVVPEIDIPGHSVAMLAAYPNLGCFGRELEVATHWGVKFDVLCIGKKSTLDFMRDILDEVTEIFDSPLIHLGGDEVPHERWKLCPSCRQKMQELGLKNFDELQAYFVNELADYLKAKGKRTVAWNEHVPSGKSDMDTIWQIWGTGGAENEPEIINNINSGRQYINSLNGYFYLDLPRRLVNLKNGYSYDPVIEGTGEASLYGVEAPLWTEYVPDYKTAIKKTLPRLTAFAETMWTMQNNKDYNRFMGEGDTYRRYLLSCGYECPSFKKGNIGKAFGWLEYAWFQKRVLHWEGLTNLLTNRRVKKTYGNQNDKE